MAIEIALLVAGVFLVSGLIWRSHRVLSRQLSELQQEVNAQRNVVPLGTALPTPLHTTTKNETREHDMRQLERELEAAQNTLVPPQEVASLLAPALAIRERRLVPRHQTSKAGKIILHDGRRGDFCTVSNVSPAGALLLVANPYDLPEQFDLSVDGHSRRCTARWRRLHRVGVQFEARPAAS